MREGKRRRGRRVVRVREPLMVDVVDEPGKKQREHVERKQHGSDQLGLNDHHCKAVRDVDRVHKVVVRDLGAIAPLDLANEPVQVLVLDPERAEQIEPFKERNNAQHKLPERHRERLKLPREQRRALGLRERLCARHERVKRGLAAGKRQRKLGRNPDAAKGSKCADDVAVFT
eukprot:Amastigsp_a1878_7.p5 type:complete len:173 gc:universal Amastigsp_a1878_7:2148-1630(-)